MKIFQNTVEGTRWEWFDDGQDDNFYNRRRQRAFACPQYIYTLSRGVMMQHFINKGDSAICFYLAKNKK